MKNKKSVSVSYLLGLLILLHCSVGFSATTNSSSNWWTTFTDNLQQTWTQPSDVDLYLPVFTWHNRWTYNKDKANSYNEQPWGAGLGISRYQVDNWQSWYAMAFKDSFNQWEPIAGYGYEHWWHPFADQRFHLGLGGTFGVTMRNNWHYYPIPVILPLASVGYNRLTLQATYIPGFKENNGNVLFAWLRWRW